MLSGSKNFQSHFGLILSLDNFVKVIYPFFAFNPILVWFYHARTAHAADELHLSIPFWSDFIVALFPCVNSRLCTFNPILVWFYPSPSVLSSGEHEPAFNPILVWFYHSATKMRWLPNCSFNPILVWFYRKLLLQNSHQHFSQLSIPFWSDFIAVDGPKRYGNFQLSIPFWSDFILKHYLMTLRVSIIFQSHFGLILSS